MSTAFEDILQEVGGFGKYQKCLIIFFLVPSTLVVPTINMASLFWTSTPDHWCRVPEVANYNLSIEEQRQVISPPKDRHCSMYDIDYMWMVKSGNRTVDPKWPTKKCQNGWQYDTTYYDANSVTKWNLVCGDDHYPSLILTLGTVGLVLGTPLFGYMSDKFGRKPIFLLMSFVAAVTDISSILSPFFPLFLLLRVLNGLGLTIIYTMGFIITLELVPPDVRAQVNVTATMAWTCGLCLLPLLMWLARDWLYMSIISSLAAGMLCLYWKFLPESPRWLISQHRYQEAHDILTKVSKCNSKVVHKTTYLMERIEEVGDHLKSQSSKQNQASPLDFVRYPKLRQRFLLISTSWICCFIPYYGLQMNVRNLAGNEFLNFFYMSVVEAPAYLTAWVMMERIGRRWAAISAFGLAAATCILPVFFSEGYETLRVVAGLLGKTGVSAAYSSIYMLAPELFPTNLRAVGIGICSTIGTGCTLVVPYIVYMAKYSHIIPYFCFTLLSVGGAIAVLFLPETMGHELPQTVGDVEDFVSDLSFWPCGRLADTGSSPDSSSGQKVDGQAKLDTRSKEIKDFYRKRGSLESLDGIFSIS